MKKQPITRETVLALLRDKAPRALHVGELQAKLGAEARERDDIYEVLGPLIEEHIVQEMPGGRFRYDKRAVLTTSAAVQKKSQKTVANEVLGRFGMNPRGFGFVTAEDGGPDVFIAPPNTGGAMHGDQVRVQWQKSTKGREGLVLGIVSRARTRIVGVLARYGKELVIEPQDPRVRGPITVVEALPPTAKEGLIVVGEITRFPRGIDDSTEARVLQALGRPGVASVEIQSIKIRDGIIEEFSDDVIAEAELIPREVPEADKVGREDLRGIDLVTIDPEDARDHDDAVWAGRNADGSYRIIVAIADVSHYVREGTAIDREALARGCSVYLPDRAIAMLPHQLSSNLASLVPNQDRLTLAVEVELTRQGVIRSHRYIEGVMRSGARLNYGAVAHALGLTVEAPAQPEAEARKDLLELLLEISDVLRAKRKRRGSLDFDLPEPRVKLDPATDEPVDVYRSRVDTGVRRAYQLIEDFMLLANEVVAEDFAKRDIPTIYRVHGAPDPTKIERFTELASSFGYSLDADAMENPLKLSAFINKIAGTPHAQPLSFLLLRSMQQATYDTTNIGHFGLAAKDYLHFTSPIRRYPDLAVHRVLRLVLRGEIEAARRLQSKLQTWATESSRLERRAMEAEREAVDLYRAILMRNRVGEEFDATITSVVGWGFYAAFDAPFVEAIVPIDTLGNDFFELDDHGIRLVGAKSGISYGMGDRVRVKVETVSVSERKISASLVDHVGLDITPKKFSRPLESRGGDKPPTRRFGVAKNSSGDSPRGKSPALGGSRKGRVLLGVSARSVGERRDEEGNRKSGGGAKGKTGGPKGGGPKKGGPKASRPKSKGKRR